MLKSYKSTTAILATCAALGQPAFALDYPTETADGLPATGFVISIDGAPIVGEEKVVKIAKKVEAVIEAADVQIDYDVDDPTPSLNVFVKGSATGGSVQIVSATNYPTFIKRGEIRLIDRSAAGGPRLLATAPLGPNSTMALPLPNKGDLVIVYRVYDKHGRFDETHPVALFETDIRPRFSAAQPTVDFTATRNIQVYGGTVTVSADNVAPGGQLATLGETVVAGADGRVVLQRIMPGGDYAVDVELVSAKDNISFGRDISLDTSEWTYFLVADATLWRRSDGQTGGRYTENSVRVQGFVEGETERGVGVTASIDTGEGDIKDIFKRLSEKDPRAYANRMSESLSHLTYGDDSTTEDRTPTSGRIYLKVEKDNNFVLWGDYTADISGSAYLRNERTLYGLQAHAESKVTTSRGDARISFDAFASKPDQQVGRDIFKGTGGSVYFLSQQDIVEGTASVVVVRRDTLTGRVIERTRLQEGRDFTFNALQGTITLARPLAGATDSGLIQTNAGGDAQILLEVQYEHTSTGFDGNGLSAGARVEHWATDDLRFGATVMSEDSGVADQTALGFDVRYEFGKNSFAQLDYAKTQGPGYGSLFSTDGGLTLDSAAANAGSGEAIKFEAQFDLADFSNSQSGVAGGYFENRTLGFNTYDHNVVAATGDQELYGVFYNRDLQNGLSYGASVDRVDNEFGTDILRVGAEVEYWFADAAVLTFAGEYLEENTNGVLATRTDIAAKLRFAISDQTEAYVFGQQTVSNKGLQDNNRYGVGFVHDFGNDWELAGEYSDGTTGQAFKLTAVYEDSDGTSYYFGYDVDPTRSYNNGVSVKDNAKYVAGGRRQITEDFLVFGEHSYDLFGSRKEQLGTYGFEYQATSFLSFGGTISEGRVVDPSNGNLTRSAYSLSFAYDDEDLTARGRLEYRKDREVAGSGRLDTDTLAFAGSAKYQIDESQRVLLEFVATETKADTNSLLGGRFVEASLGYALRPVEHERYNVLASYRYVLDDYGQSVDGVVGAGAIQESHILNIEGNYDLSEKWTLGVKFGARKSKTAPSSGLTMVDNDAWLGVVNARFEVTKKWDVLLEARHFEGVDSGFSETGGLISVSRKVGENIKVGVGYNFSSFSDDLSDMTHDDKGIFINLVATF